MISPIDPVSVADVLVSADVGAVGAVVRADWACAKLGKTAIEHHSMDFNLKRRIVYPPYNRLHAVVR
jgi:hypothetical protein